MNADQDPRRSVWCTQINVNGVNVYQGIESGYPPSLEYQVGKNSSYNDIMRTLPELGIMMTYSEVESIKAELALKGFTTGKTPKEHNKAAIMASMAQWGVNPPDDYLTRPGVRYHEEVSTTEQLERKMLQKYYAFFFVDYQS